MTTTPDLALAGEYFAAKLRFETDPSDVRHALDTGERFVLVDTRGDAAWHQERIAGAVHMPTADITDRAPREIPIEVPVVVYCWGPGCNGSTRAALAFARLGYRVREMIGGFEYWAREGLGTENADGPVLRAVDTLTAPAGDVRCDC